MMTDVGPLGRPADDPVSNVLKWILLAVAVATFAILGWTTNLTYKAAPPFPDRFVTADGTLLMSAADIQAGKAGFQKADLMDYGSLYGMGSYFGEDYTASNLVRLATLTEDEHRQGQNRQSAVGSAHRKSRPRSKLRCRSSCRASISRKQVATVPDAVAAAITTLRGEIAQSLLRHDFAKGWTPGLQPRRAERRGRPRTS